MTKTWLLVKKTIHGMFGTYHVVKYSLPAYAKYGCR